MRCFFGVVLLFLMISARFCSLESFSIQPISIGKNIVEGQRLKLICSISSGTTSSVTFEWFKDDLLASNKEDLIIRNLSEDTNELTINPITRDHAGSYKCVAKNAEGQDSSTVNIQVNGK